MNLRIISGEFGGRKIEAPDTGRTHPMSERIRNAVFNSIGREIESADVLDVFAGTGAVGLEALSRGARQVTFIERDRIAQKILARNISSLHVENRTVISRATASNWFEQNEDMRFDLIFADPPYQDPQLSTVSHFLGLLKPGGLMVLSHPGRGEELAKAGVVVVGNRSLQPPQMLSAGFSGLLVVTGPDLLSERRLPPELPAVARSLVAGRDRPLLLCFNRTV